MKLPFVSRSTTLAIKLLVRTSVLLMVCARAWNPVPANAQAVYGSVGGSIVDSSGSVIPGATVTVTSVDRKTSDTVVTNESGRYVKERLLPGPYEVKAELSGFKTAVFPDIVVNVDTQTKVDVRLDVGQLTEAVEVTATQGQLLKTDRADVATTFESREITDLPVLDRNFTKFILLTPGTQQLHWQHAASENPQGSTQTMVNGQHFSGTGYQLDGTENRDPILGIIVINPNLESIGETKITSQNYDAEFGQATAGVVSVQTKSGTNSFHGSAFEFHQDDRFQSRNPFTQTAPDPLTGRFLPKTNKNQFGGSIGGPIVKNEWFFFGDYEGTRSNVGGSKVLTVPTAAARNGDLSAYGINIFDPNGGAGAAARSSPSNVIPADRLSPQAQAILKLIPLPNRPGTQNGTRDNFSASGSEPFNNDTFDVRVDGRASDRLNLFGRYSFADYSRNGPTAFGAGGGQELVSLGGTSKVRNQSLATGFDRSIGTKTTLDFRLGYFKYKVDVLPFDFGTTPATDAGIPGLNLDNGFTSGLFGGFIGEDSDSRRIRFGSGLGVNRCNCPLDRGREAVAAGREPDEGPRQPHGEVRRRRAARLQPARAERRAPLGRALVHRQSHDRPERRRPGARDVPARRRDALRALHQPVHRRGRAAVAPFLLRAGHLARQCQADAQLRAAPRLHQPANRQRCRQGRVHPRTVSDGEDSIPSHECWWLEWEASR